MGYGAIISCLKRVFVHWIFIWKAREWLHNIGIGDQTAVVHDNEEPDDGAVPVHHGDVAKNRWLLNHFAYSIYCLSCQVLSITFTEWILRRYVPSRAALPVIRAALGAQQTISENAKVAMQGYLNHFLGNLDIVNSREVHTKLLPLLICATGLMDKVTEIYIQQDSFSWLIHHLRNWNL